MKDVALVSSPGKCDLATLFDQHFAYVWSTLVRLGVRTNDLEDVLQEVFLRLHTTLNRYDPERPVRPWIFGFAYRVAADYRRLARHRIEILGIPVEPVDPSRRADERIEVNEELASVETALQSVELDRRAVLVLHDIDEVPIPAIARELGIPVNTAYSRLRLAREDFNASLGRQRKVRGAT